MSKGHSKGTRTDRKRAGMKKRHAAIQQSKREREDERRYAQREAQERDERRRR